MKVTRLSTFIAFTVTGFALGACPGGWLSHEDFCYYFSTDQLNWKSAQEACVAKGGYLAEPTTRRKSDFIAWVSGQDGGKYYWLGGTDAAVEGEWIWKHSNQPFTNTYTNWGAGEPNNLLFGENCLHMLKDQQKHWNDFSCEFPNYYICEQKLSSVDLGPVVPINIG